MICKLASAVRTTPSTVIIIITQALIIVIFWNLLFFFFCTENTTFKVLLGSLYWFLEKTATKTEPRAGAVRNRSVSGLGRDGPLLAIAFEVLTRRFLGWRTRYGRKGGLLALGVMTGFWSWHPIQCPYTRIPTLKSVNFCLTPFFPLSTVN